MNPLRRTARRTKGLAPARLGDPKEWAKVMQAPQLLTESQRERERERERKPLPLAENRLAGVDIVEIWQTTQRLSYKTTPPLNEGEGTEGTEEERRLQATERNGILVLSSVKRHKPCDSPAPPPASPPRRENRLQNGKKKETELTERDVAMIWEETQRLSYKSTPPRPESPPAKESEEKEIAQEEKKGGEESRRPQRRKKGVAPVRLGDAEEWAKIMDGYQLKKSSRLSTAKEVAASGDFQIGIWWKDGCFFYGVVVEYDEVKRKHLIQYDDGDVQWHNLKRELIDLTKSYARNSFDQRGFLSYKSVQQLFLLLSFESVSELQAWLRSKFKPQCIPREPEFAYKSFTTYEDLLSPDKRPKPKQSAIVGEDEKKRKIKLKDISTALNESVQRNLFNRMRSYAHTLKLNTPAAWVTLYDSGKLMKGAPRDPSLEFQNWGWISWCDFLGCRKEWQSFYLARDFASGLQLSSEKEWHDYCEFMKMPHTIPANPREVYKKNWKSWRDFLSDPPSEEKFINEEVWAAIKQKSLSKPVKPVKVTSGRVIRFKPINETKHKRCGYCKTCLNRHLKKACITVREKMIEEMKNGNSL